ncbi:DUF3606 domain-containing protein [Mesorhizobium sp. M0016]|uniref:DUF3606 domain-containing protein n=1 Tax=Mesorhizobium sp. M0016 TaxID=2956843 RepID=UPI0033366527
MADDKSKRDFRDRDRVSADEDYEVEYFAAKAGITPQQVKELSRSTATNAKRWSEKRRLCGNNDQAIGSRQTNNWAPT